MPKDINADIAQNGKLTVRPNGTKPYPSKQKKSSHSLIRQADSEQQIKECLNCTLPNCDGGGICMRINHKRLEKRNQK